jgi:hypothetical protein|tara:strand:+ start:985 stop:1554 length:570 start_codon:yes stop_codon:yes gene_type:complete
MWPAIIGGGISLLGSMMANKPKMKTVTNQDLAGNYSDFTKNLDRQNDLSEQLIDPNSNYNLNQSQRIKNMGYDNMAFSNMLGNRNMAQGGMGGYSGIRGQQQQAGMDKVQQESQNRINQMISSNFGAGMQGLQGIGKGYQSMGDTMSQNMINNTAAQNQIAQARSQSDFQGMLGFGQGLMQYGLMNPTT